MRGNLVNAGQFSEFHGSGANTLFMPVSTECAMFLWIIDENENPFDTFSNQPKNHYMHSVDYGLFETLSG